MDAGILKYINFPLMSYDISDIQGSYVHTFQQIAYHINL